MADQWAAKGWMTTEITGMKELDRASRVARRDRKQGIAARSACRCRCHAERGKAPLSGQVRQAGKVYPGQVQAHRSRIAQGTHVLSGRPVKAVWPPRRVRDHPGTSPQPFLRPAFDESQSEIIQAMQRRMRRGIEQEARRLARANIAKRRAARRG